nr:MAG TPA: hypothetical protein [Caudoviricetes sp.]
MRSPELLPGLLTSSTRVSRVSLCPASVIW